MKYSLIYYCRRAYGWSWRISSIVINVSLITKTTLVNQILGMQNSKQKGKRMAETHIHALGLHITYKWMLNVYIKKNL